MYHFCTIASGNYMPFVQTLFASLRRQGANVALHVLVTDGNFQDPGKEGLHIHQFSQIKNDLLIEKVIHQFKGNNNHLRWALKPVFLRYLLKDYETLIYVDNDICFFHPFQFLFEQLSDASILVTPHWFNMRPYPVPENFDTNFQIGLFNAGFIGASRQGMAFLEWWAEACLYRMERAEPEGFYDDQRFLDMCLLVDENAAIVRHPGCNIGSWNMHQNKRMKVDNKVLINGVFPVVFVHFNHETIRHILNGNDALLEPYLEEYKTYFAKTGFVLGDYITSLPDWSKQTAFQVIQRKTKIRTRIKSWLFQLSQKL